MKKTRIILADDHQMFLDGLCSLLSELKGIEILATVNNGQQVMDQLKNARPDLLIIDLNMPGLNGIETTRLVKKNYPEIKVLGLTMDNDLNSVTQLLEAGASGYILKNTGKDELELAIQQVMKGEHYLSQAISAQLAQNLLSTIHKKTETKEIHTLTEREVEILKMIALENSNADIAEALFISQKTVETHRKNLMRKIGVRNSLGVYKYAIKHNLIEG